MCPAYVTVTTDVQSVSLCSIDDTTYAVGCTFLNGSSSRGCTYTLMGVSPHVQDLTGYSGEEQWKGRNSGDP